MIILWPAYRTYPPPLLDLAMPNIIFPALPTPPNYVLTTRDFHRFDDSRTVSPRSGSLPTPPPITPLFIFYLYTPPRDRCR